MNSWFEIHCNDPLIPNDYFKEQLRVRKETFEVILNHLNPHLTRQDTAMHDCTTPAETAASIETFRENTRSELVNVAGAIDGTHIKIIAPRENALDHFSRCQQHDFIIQAVVDGGGKFIDAVCGFPGSAHDARVLRNSELYYNAERGNILQAPVVTIGGRDIRPYLVGDSAYPQAPWLIKPFPEGTRDPEEQTFNKELSRA